MKNDIKHYKQLEQMDIKVIVIWECELKKSVLIIAWKVY